MKKTLAAVAVIPLGAVVLAVVTNLIAEYIDIPLGLTLLIGAVALLGLIAAELH
jgi:hypothetical protein